MAKKVIMSKYIGGSWTDMFPATLAEMVTTKDGKSLQNVLDYLQDGYTKMLEQNGDFTTSVNSLTITEPTFVPGRDNFVLFVGGQKLDLNKNYSYDGQFTITKMDDGTGTRWTSDFGDYSILISKLQLSADVDDFGNFDGNQIEPNSVSENKLTYGLKDKIRRTISTEVGLMELYRKEMLNTNSDSIVDLSDSFKLINLKDSSYVDVPNTTATLDAVNKKYSFGNIEQKLKLKSRVAEDSFDAMKLRLYSDSLRKVTPITPTVNSNQMTFTENMSAGERLYLEIAGKMQEASITGVVGDFTNVSKLNRYIGTAIPGMKYKNIHFVPDACMDAAGNIYIAAWVISAIYDLAATDRSGQYHFQSYVFKIDKSTYAVTDMGFPILANYSSKINSIRVGTNDHIHVLLQQQNATYVGSDQIAYSKYSSGSWSAVAILNPDAARPRNHPSMDIDASNNIFITYCATDATYGNNQVFYCINTGGTWGSHIRITNQTNYNQQYTKIIATGVNKFVIVWTGRTSTYPDYDNLYSVYYDGNSLSSIMMATSGSDSTNPVFLGQMQMAKDSTGKVYLVFKTSNVTYPLASGGAIGLKVFDGSTWSGVTYVDTSPGRNALISGIQINAANEIFISYVVFSATDLNNPELLMKIKKSTNLGGSFIDFYTSNGETNLRESISIQGCSNFTSPPIIPGGTPFSIHGSWTANSVTYTHLNESPALNNKIFNNVAATVNPQYLSNVVVDSLGNYYVAVMDLAAKSFKVLKISKNLSSVVDLGVPNTGYTMKSDLQLAIDSSGLLHVCYVAYTAAYTSTYQLLHVYWNGTTWSTTNTINGSAYNVSAPRMVIDNLGDIHLVAALADATTTSDLIKYMKFTKSTMTWSSWLSLVTAAQIGASNSMFMPDIALDPSGYPHVVWHGMYSSETLHRIWYIKKIDASNWSTPARITPIKPGGSGSHETTPSIVCSAGGKVDILYCQTTNYFLYHVQYNGTSWQNQTAVRNVLDFGIVGSGTTTRRISRMKVIGSSIFACVNMNALFGYMDQYLLEYTGGAWVCRGVVRVNNYTGISEPTFDEAGTWTHPMTFTIRNKDLYAHYSRTEGSGYICTLDKAVSASGPIYVSSQLSAKVDNVSLPFSKIGKSLTGEFIEFKGSFPLTVNDSIEIKGTKTTLDSISIIYDRNILSLSELLPASVITGYNGNLVSYDAGKLNGLTPDNYLTVSGKDKEDSYSSYMTVYDANDIATTIEYKRMDGTLHKRSVLSGGTSPKYTTRTVTYYGADGTTVTDTIVFTLSYIGDKLYSEERQA